MRSNTARTLTAATVAGLALFGAACSDDTRDELGDVGQEMEQDVEEGAENVEDAVDGQD